LRAPDCRFLATYLEDSLMTETLLSDWIKQAPGLRGVRFGARLGSREARYFPADGQMWKEITSRFRASNCSTRLQDGSAA